MKIAIFLPYLRLNIESSTYLEGLHIDAMVIKPMAVVASEYAMQYKATNMDPRVSNVFI